MVEVEEFLGDIIIQWKGVDIRFVIKTNYLPPLLWIEAWQPRAQRWGILKQVVLDERILQLLRTLVKEGEKALKKAEKDRRRWHGERA